MTPQETSISKDRASIISSVKTPLGFFTLVVLVVEGGLGTLAGTVLSGTDRSLALYGMLVLIGVLIAVVVLLAVLRPEVVGGARDGKLQVQLDQVRATAERTQAENHELRAECQRIEEQNRVLREENLRLSEETSRIDSVRLRILAILLARGSADLSEIMGDLDIHFRGPNYDQALGVLGSLVDSGKVQRDEGKGGHYYMLTKR